VPCIAVRLAEIKEMSLPHPVRECPVLNVAIGDALTGYTITPALTRSSAGSNLRPPANAFQVRALLPERDLRLFPLEAPPKGGHSNLSL